MGVSSYRNLRFLDFAESHSAVSIAAEKRVTVKAIELAADHYF
jgi:hypothetical protein